MKAAAPKYAGIDRKDRFLILSSVAVGLLSTVGGNWEGLTALWGLIPLLWLETGSRLSAFCVPFAFYPALSRGIVPGAAVFFRDGSLIRAFILWLSSAAALSLPWGFLWTPIHARMRPVKNAWKILCAVAVSAIPPLGLIGWGSPLVAAGAVFPGTGWAGLALLLLLYAGSALSPGLRRLMILLLLLSAPFLTLPPAPEKRTLGDVTIYGINTAFGRVASGSGDFDAQYERERMVFRYLREMKNNAELEGTDIVVLPETLIGRMNPSVRRRWKRFFDRISDANGPAFIVGAEIPTDRGMKYNNTMVVFNGEEPPQTALQQIPVPFSMYRGPFGSTGAKMYLSSFGERSTLTLKGKKFGVLICYEQFLVWPFLTILSRRPDAILAPSNLWWCRETSLPGIQSGTMWMLGRLFGLPVIPVVNK
jgi:apolipoprotein N-acyltransferase